jgi:hypothetical protein
MHSEGTSTYLTSFHDESRIASTRRAGNGQKNMKRPCESPVKFETIAIND